MSKSVLNIKDVYFDTKWLDNNILTAGISSDYQITASNQIETIPINKTLCSVGHKLSTNGNGIVIGKNVSKILVSAQVYWYTDVSTTGDSICYIRKNTETLVTNNSRLADPYEHTQLSLRLVNVSEGDVINLSVKSEGSTPIIKSYTHGTFLTVQVIE